jgi:hypothetical protein
MDSWWKLTFTDANQLLSIIGLARHNFTDGVGVFSAREGLALFFSPIAKSVIPDELALSFFECARPDELAVEVVVGPYDQPGWYEQDPEDIAYDLEVLEADEAEGFDPILLEEPTPRKIA